jgi:hypothetical protein
MRATTALTLLLAAGLAAAPAQARYEGDDEDPGEPVFYNGFGVSRARTEFVNLGAAANLEVVMGFRVPTLSWLAVELDIAQTVVPGRNDPVDPGLPISNCGAVNQGLGLCTPGGSEPATFDRRDLSLQALGVSAAFRTPGRLYLAGRYGYRYLSSSISELNRDDSSLGFGVGAGYRWGDGAGVELAYKELAGGVESIGLTFHVRTPR